MPIVTLQQGFGGYTGCTDTWIVEPSQNNNCGGHASLLFGWEGSGNAYRTLMRWDLSSILAGSICASASLQLYDQNYAGRTVNNPINIYQPSVANADWVAGTGNNTGSEVGSSSWNNKIYFTVPWAGSEGLSTPTTDYVNTSLAAYTFIDGSSGYKTINFNAAGIAYLQTLFGGTGVGGLLIIGDQANNDSLTICDSANGTNTPKLEIVLADSGVAQAFYRDFPKFLMRPTKP